MSGSRTNAHEMAKVLKASCAPLDTCRGMRTQDLKLRLERRDYDVDPALVAEAMLRRFVSYRRCWNPRRDWAMPADVNSTFTGPSTTAPIQVTGTADSAA